MKIQPGYPGCIFSLLTKVALATFLFICYNVSIYTIWWCDMLRPHQEQQQGQWELVYLEQLVRPDHLLRMVQKHVDFGFVFEKVKHLYCEDNGRPALDPVILFKMLFIGYLFGIRSERRLVQEIADNVAYRWFCGFSLSQRIPDASTIWQNRHRRWKDSEVHQEIFDEIVRRAIEAGFISGKELFTDSTHIKASANKRKCETRQVAASTKSYMDELDRAVAEDREQHGKKPLARGKEVQQETREMKVSLTDPDSGYMMRDGKPEGFFYLEHRTVDGKHNFITDVHVTPGNVHDSVPYIERLDRQRKVFKFQVKRVALDAGYLTSPICHALQQREIFAVIGHRRFTPVKGLFPKWKFTYDPEADQYKCPGDSILTYRTTNREGYRQYASDPKTCCNCPLRDRCTKSRAARKVITRHVWESSREWVRENRLSERGKKLKVRRSETVERSFADSKELHGHRYARMRGKHKVREQCLMCATAQNIKKLAMLMDRLEGVALSA